LTGTAPYWIVKSAPAGDREANRRSRPGGGCERVPMSLPPRRADARLDVLSAFLYLLLFYVMGLGLCVQADLWAQV